MEKVFINWKKDKLYGWEKEKNIHFVNAIAEAIEDGEEIEPIEVFQLGPNKYVLHGGGHHRALAHYILGKHLEAKVISKPENEMGLGGLIKHFNIAEIVLYDHLTDFDGSVYQEVLSRQYETKLLSTNYPRLKPTQVS